MIFQSETLTRRTIFRGVLLIIGVVLLYLVLDLLFALFVESRPALFSDKRYYYHVIGDQKVIALTFDDGPDPEKTDDIIRILEKHDVPATFFFLGENVLEYPDVARRAFERGFEIGNHTFTHAKEVHSSPLRLSLELRLTNKLIRDAIGVETFLYRPPYLLDEEQESDAYSEADPNSPFAWANADGYVAVGADIDSRDWEANSPEDVRKTFFNNLAKTRGHIALFHDGGQGVHTLPVLEDIIVELKAQGYRFTLASELIGIDAYNEMLVTRDLREGMRDTETAQDVSQLQRFLLKEGEAAVISGKFDLKTRWALETWQAARGLEEELGFVGPLTRARIAQDLKHFRHTDIMTEQGFHGVAASVSSFHVIGWLATWVGPLLTATIFLAFIRLAFVLSLYLLHRISRKKRKKRAILDDVTVLVPAFNEEENVMGTLVSILHNSVRPKQVIVIDDGSTDDTALKVREFMREHSGVQLLQQSNGGKARALNRGLAEVSTQYFIAIDGDTVLDRHAIKHLMHHISGTDLAAVAGTVMPIHTRTWLEKFQYLEYIVSQSIEKNALARVNAISVVPGPIGVWRADAVRHVGGYCTDTMVEDQALTLALHAYKYSISYEVKAKAYTETPHTISDFIKQRYRWTFGMLQCVWKFKIHFFSLDKPALGFIIMPNAAVFGFIVAMLYPIMDIALIIGLILGQASHIASAYLLFTALDIAYSLFAHKDLGKHKSLLLLLPLQRLFYRGVMYYVVLRSVVSAIEGSRAKWNRVHKKGDAYAYLVQLFEKRGYRI